MELAVDLYKTSVEITGAEFPDVSHIRSPCPTLNVIGALSKAMIEKEELKRMVERPGFNEDGTVIKISKRKRVKAVTQKVVGGVLSRTVGRVAGFLSRRLLGRVPETALEGSFQEEKPEDFNKLKAAQTVVPETTISGEEIEVVPEEPELSVVTEKTINTAEDILAEEIKDQVFAEYEEKKMKEMKSDEELIGEAMMEKSSSTTMQNKETSGSGAM